MKSRTPVLSPSFRSVVYSIVIFGGLGALFTFLGVLLGPQGAQVGGTRPLGNILTHVEELAGLGVVLGIGTVSFYGRKGLPFVVLTPILVILLDVDHVPAYLGFTQPIRPSHSLIFLVSALVLTAMVIRRLDFDLVVLSAAAGHMAVDTGLFPPFAPFSFEYVSLDPYRLPLFIVAIVASCSSGVLLMLRTTRVKGDR